MTLNNKIPFHLIGKKSIAYSCNFIPDEYGWHELPDYIDELVDSAKSQATCMIEHKIESKDLELYLNVALIVLDKDFFIIYIGDFLDHLFCPVHFNNSSDKISEWEISCSGWPDEKDDIFRWYFPELPYN